MLQWHYTLGSMRARSSVDRATDSGSVGRGFKSLRARLINLICKLPDY